METSGSRVNFVSGLMTDVQRPDQRVALIQVLHKNQNIRSSDGKAWIRVLGLFPSREAAKARVISLVREGASAQEIRLVPTCGSFLIGSEKYKDQLDERTRAPTYIDMDTRARENAKVARLLVHNERKRASERAEVRRNMAKHQMGLVEYDYRTGLLEDVDGHAPASGWHNVVYEEQFKQALAEIEAKPIDELAEDVSASTTSSSSRGGASESKDEEAPRLVPADPAPAPVTRGLPEISADQTLRAQNYAVIGIIDDDEIIKAQSIVAKTYIEARDREYQRRLNDMLNAYMTERSVSAEDLTTYRDDHFLRYLTDNPYPLKVEWERQRNRMFAIACRNEPERVAAKPECTHEDLLLEAEPLEGEAPIDKPYLDWLRKNPMPTMPLPEELPEDPMSLENADLRVWWHIWDERFRKDRWVDFLKVEVPDRATIMRDYYEASPPPNLSYMPQQEPIVAVIAAFQTPEEATEFVENRVRKLDGVRDWYIGCIAMYECVPIEAHTDRRIKALYHHKELQDLADQDRESAEKKRELDFKAKAAGKKYKTVEVYGTDISVDPGLPPPAPTEGESDFTPLDAAAETSTEGPAAAAGGGGAAAGGGAAEEAIEAASRVAGIAPPDHDRFRFEFRDLKDVLSKEFHRDTDE